MGSYIPELECKLDYIMILCLNCKTQPKKKHKNAKWCKLCADELKHRPKSNLTPTERREVLKLRGKMRKEEIANQVGVSRASINRLGRELNLSFNFCNQYKANPKFVQQVCEYYSKHGRTKTRERFPQVNLRSIVERYKDFAPRQVRWTPEQLKDLARMGGIISIKSQFKYFNRPRAYRGSIVSVWMKHFGFGGGVVNGLSWNMAKHFVIPDCKPMRTHFWRQRGDGKGKRMGHSRRVVLWVDMKKYLRPDSPSWLKESIDSLAKFQVWLHGSTRVRLKINKMIREVEIIK